MMFWYIQAAKAFMYWNRASMSGVIIWKVYYFTCIMLICMHASINVVIENLLHMYNIVHRMGRRKLKFDVRKNYERRKKKKHSTMIVSIPCSLLSVDSRSDSRHLPLAEPADSSCFNVPISVLTHTSTSGALGACRSLPSSSLQISLSQCRLPSGWSLSTTQGVMALYKLYVSQAQDSLATDFKFMLTIAVDCTWTLCVAGRKQVDIQQCQVLSGTPVKFTTADEVLQLLSVLDSSALCSGNPDSKFTVLLDRHKDGFRDPSG